MIAFTAVQNGRFTEILQQSKKKQNNSFAHLPHWVVDQISTMLAQPGFLYNPTQRIQPSTAMARPYDRYDDYKISNMYTGGTLSENKIYKVQNPFQEERLSIGMWR